MSSKIMQIRTGIILFVSISVGGCGVWPVMTEENGWRPQAMGKDDQIFSPWAPQPIHLSERYGQSYRFAMETQIFNPEATKSLAVVEGVGGVPAALSITRYQALFQRPPFWTIGRSGGGRSSGNSGGGNR